MKCREGEYEQVTKRARVCIEGRTRRVRNLTQASPSVVCPQCASYQSHHWLIRSIVGVLAKKSKRNLRAMMRSREHVAHVHEERSLIGRKELST